MRRLALLMVGGAVWLFLAAIPALADGGPHVAAINNGSLGINADSCAGCHRAHTAQAAYLLASSGNLCLTCHGTTSTGATTDVENGIQYQIGRDGTTGTVLGALRDGGFVEARIGSDSVYRVGYLRNAAGAVSFRTKVPVKSSGQAVTSSHIPGIAGLTVSGGRVFGNGAINSGAGAAIVGELECTSCHNPHGNGNYRILNPIPTVDVTGGTFVPASAGVNVADAPLPSSGDTRNYTVIQTIGTQSTGAGYLLYASQVIAGGYSNTSGDYLHRTVPWDPQNVYTVYPSAPNATANDAPNGRPANLVVGGVQQYAFNYQINAWCSTCHTRYATIDATGGTTVVGGGSSWNTNSGDNIFTYRHSNSSNKPCVTCHVAHGSNAQMTGTFTTNETYPGGSTATGTDSRLLKIDNRGTCQACHDPTGTVVAGQVSPTGASAPVPYVP